MIRDYRQRRRRTEAEGGRNNEVVKVTAPSSNTDQVIKHIKNRCDGSAAHTSSFYMPPYLHDAQSLSLLHLAQNRSEDLVQLLPELGSCPRDQSGHQPAHEGSRELGGPGVQQLVDHLHDVPEAAVPLLVPPLSDLLEGDGDVRPQTLPAVLQRGGKSRSKRSVFGQNKSHATHYSEKKTLSGLPAL